ncbi:MAG TPA: hypothetical protein VMU15_04335 [Anaeromyxobacter sp.]|nr:hypothetical protein [Anaeromyxobacter sp.]
MARISRNYPGRTDQEIFARVDEVMRDVARRHSLDYESDGAGLRGSVAKLGGHGTFAVRGGEVAVELRYPMLVPGSLKRKVEEDIAQKLDGLFA